MAAYNHPHAIPWKEFDSLRTGAEHNRTNDSRLILEGKIKMPGTVMICKIRNFSAEKNLRQVSVSIEKRFHIGV